MADNIPDEIMQELERLRTNLEARDKFIVSKGLWGEFVAQLGGEGLIGKPLEPLGREFEVIWDQNTSILYEE